MAKNKVEIDVKVDDKGTTKKLGLESQKAAAKGIDDLGKGAHVLLIETSKALPRLLLTALRTFRKCLKAWEAL